MSGYARVSTGAQDVAGQTMRLTGAGAIRWSADYWGAKAPDGRTNEEYAQEKLNELLSK